MLITIAPTSAKKASFENANKIVHLVAFSTACLGYCRFKCNLSMLA